MTLCDERGGPRQAVEIFQRVISSSWSLVLSLEQATRLCVGNVDLPTSSLKYDTVGALVESLYVDDDPDLNDTLTRLIRTLEQHAVASAPAVGLNPKTFGDYEWVQTFLLFPAKSSNKRWQMLLRWMVRTKSPDLGLWNLPTSKLTIPLDVHVHGLSQMIGLTKHKSANFAKESTKSFTRIRQTDPIEYDFALAHLGISGDCQKTYKKIVLFVPCMTSVFTLKAITLKLRSPIMSLNVDTWTKPIKVHFS